MGKITLIGIGPGKDDQMTSKAKLALNEADLIVGYTKYIELLAPEYAKKALSTGMRKELERCRMCFLNASQGLNVSLIASGDAGIYGLASLIYELSVDYPDIDIEVIPGITAAVSGAAVIGAPLNHDFCTISLSDLMTPWELIERRLRCAAEGDFVISIYNPSSNNRPDYLNRACKILMDVIPRERAAGYVRNIGREGTESFVGTLSELADKRVDMFTVCYVGNSRTFVYKDKLITPRGYLI